MHIYAQFWGVSLNISIFIAKRSIKNVKKTPKITIEKLEKSKGQNIETSITSEQNKILTFCKKRWHHKKATLNGKAVWHGIWRVGWGKYHSHLDWALEQPRNWLSVSLLISVSVSFWVNENKRLAFDRHIRIVERERKGILFAKGRSHSKSNSYEQSA